jgi:hypothetical protein
MLSTKYGWSWVVVAFVASSVSVPMQLLAQSTAETPKRAVPAARTHFMVAPGQVKWTDPPAGMSRGTPSVDVGPLRYALIEGDPLRAGVPFTIRLGCGDGAKVAPHWHPTDENIVVLKGTFGIGPGDVFNPAEVKDISVGSYGFMPRRMHHFGLCKGDTDILVYGVGPFQINWISGPSKNTASNPSKPSTQK